MLFEAAPLGEQELQVLGQIDELQRSLGLYVSEPRRWTRSLRRAQAARHIQGSNSIEGFEASLDDAAAIELGEEPIDASAETAFAIKGYSEAMTFVLQLAADESFAYSEMLLRSLHFMMTSYDLANRPGRWRSGSIYVRDDATERNVYEGPPVEDVPRLIDALVTELRAPDPAEPIIRAAMAHLNLVMIHPFRDGNGRMARCLQTLVLSRERILAPEFSSIEEYLGRDTRAYYDVLASTGRGSWQPDNDTTAWIRFSLLAHLRQARSLLRRVRESERLWSDLEQLVRASGLPERTIPALWNAAVGYRIRRSVYVAMGDDWGEEITEQTATRDLRLLVDRRLLVPKGEKRGRHYVASPAVRGIHDALIAQRDPRDDLDPFASS